MAEGEEKRADTKEAPATPKASRRRGGEDTGAERDSLYTRKKGFEERKKVRNIYI